MGVVTGCSPAVWAGQHRFFRALAVLRCGDDPGEYEAKTAKQPPVTRRTGQDQVDVVEEDHEQADDAQRDHHDGQPGWARGMNGARARRVASRCRRAHVGGLGRLLGRTALWGDASAGSTSRCWSLVGSHSGASVAVEWKLVRRDRPRPIGSCGDGRTHPCPR